MIYTPELQALIVKWIFAVVARNSFPGLLEPIGAVIVFDALRVVSALNIVGHVLVMAPASLFAPSSLMLTTTPARVSPFSSSRIAPGVR